MATFQNNKKKDWFSQETLLVFVHGNIFRDRSQNSASFKMKSSLQLSNGKVYNQWTVVLAFCCSNLTIFTCKIKIG